MTNDPNTSLGNFISCLPLGIIPATRRVFITMLRNFFVTLQTNSHKTQSSNMVDGGKYGNLCNCFAKYEKWTLNGTLAMTHCHIMAPHKLSYNYYYYYHLYYPTRCTDTKRKVKKWQSCQGNNLNATVIQVDQLVLLPLTRVLTWRTQSHQLCGISCDSDDFLSTPTAPATMKTHHTTSELLMYTTAKPTYTACETVKQETVWKEMNWGKKVGFWGISAKQWAQELRWRCMADCSNNQKCTTADSGNCVRQTTSCKDDNDWRQWWCWVSIHSTDVTNWWLMSRCKSMMASSCQVNHTDDWSITDSSTQLPHYIAIIMNPSNDPNSMTTSVSWNQTHRRAVKNASVWSLTAAAPRDSVFHALCINWITYLLASNTAITMLTVYTVKANERQYGDCLEVRGEIIRTVLCCIVYWKLLSLIHIWRCRRSTLCRSRWSPYH